MSGRALSFGPVAEAYERFRPGYPGQLVDLVIAQQVFARIRKVLPDTVGIAADIIVHLARRGGDQ